MFANANKLNVVMSYTCKFLVLILTYWGGQTPPSLAPSETLPRVTNKWRPFHKHIYRGVLGVYPQKGS